MITKIRFYFLFSFLLLNAFTSVAQFTGKIFYKSSTIKSSDTDTVQGWVEVIYSPNRILMRNSEYSAQTLHSFDEMVVRLVDTSRNLSRKDPINLEQSESVPVLIDSVPVGDDWRLHFRITQQSNLMGQTVNVTSDYWVTKSISLHCGGLKKYYNPYANGSGYALIKLSRRTEIGGFDIKTTELYLEKVEIKPYTDADLKLITAAD